MSKVTIHLAPSETMAAFLFSPADAAVLAKQWISGYRDAGSFDLEQQGEAAAEEAFDLTNNPSRQDEREVKYGRGRSVSSGDVVDVDGVKYLCLAMGWQVI